MHRNIQFEVIKLKKGKINLNKLSVMLMIFLITGFVVPLSTTMANEENTVNQEEQSVIASSNSKQYNKTDITPKNQTEQVRAQEQTMFQYRNMTILMNCTRNCTVEFTVADEVTPKVFGIDVDPSQTMTLNMNLAKSPLNGVMVNERCLNFYMGIEPNATLELQAQIRLYINQTQLNSELNREVNTSRLTWMYWNQTGTQWEPVESYMDQNGYLVCNTDHFSTWTVAEIEQSAEETQSTQNNDFLIYAAIGLVVVIVVIAFGIVAYKKRK